MSTTKHEDRRAPQRPKRSRGPSVAKTAATRQALVNAGLTLFLENGFSATRMSDVAARAGLAKGTTYLHFADKMALFAEVLRGFVNDAAGRRPIGRPRPDEPTRDFLRRSLVPVLRDIQANDRFRVLYLVVAEGERLPELTAVYRMVAVEPVLRLVRIYAARAERRGELHSDAIWRLPVLAVAPVVLGALWNNLFGRDDPLDVAVLFEGFLDLTLRDAVH